MPSRRYRPAQARSRGRNRSGGRPARTRRPENRWNQPL